MKTEEPHQPVATRRRFSARDLRSTLPTFLAIVLIGLAFLRSVQVSGDMLWPPEEDFYRDMGSAEALAAGDFFSDPAYLGEYRWYNPLTTGVVAVIHNLTGISFPLLFARAGPYLNLLGPVMVFALVALLADRWTALAALAAYLFLNDHSQPSWFTATYSPWLWPCNFTQGIAFATLFLMVQAFRKPIIVRNVAAGVFLGLTFLGHTAPPIILAGSLTLFAVVQMVRDRGRWRVYLGQWLLIAGTSLVVALPFLGPLVFIYQGRTLNPAPGNFAPWEVSEFLASYANLRGVVALVGLVLLVRQVIRPRKTGPRGIRPEWIFLPGMILVTVLCFTWGAAAQVQGRDRMVPLFHFHIYAKALEAILFGFGLVGLSQLPAALSEHRGTFARRATTLPLKLRTSRPLALFAFCLLLVGCAVPYVAGYRGWLDHHGYRQAEGKGIGKEGRADLYDWVRENTDRDEVFLSDPDTGLYAIVAAGRKVVVVHPAFSNPFVDYEERERDSRLAFQFLAQRKYQEFEEIARRYRVTFVVADGADASGALADRYPLVFRSGPYRVFRVNLAGPDSRTGVP